MSDIHIQVGRTISTIKDGSMIGYQWLRENLEDYNPMIKFSIATEHIEDWIKKMQEEGLTVEID